ncbi:MAG: DNA-directed RNA polymerase subunit omega [Propionibacteriaceae bacterium]
MATEGITNPPIDDLLTRVDSKYRLVLFASKRARQINSYYSQLGEGLLENVGPLVETAPQEKSLSIALREINAGVLECHEVIPGEDTQAPSSLNFTAESLAEIDAE